MGHGPVGVFALALGGPKNDQLLGGTKKGNLVMLNMANSRKRVVDDLAEHDVFGITTLEPFDNNFVLLQDSRYTLRLYSLEALWNEQNPSASDCLLEIKQKVESKDDMVDVYAGNKKLIELRDSTYGGTKREGSAFVLSVVATSHRVNLYVFEGEFRRQCRLLCTCKKIWTF